MRVKLINNNAVKSSEKVLCKAQLEVVSEYVKSVRNSEVGSTNPSNQAYSEIEDKYQCTRKAIVTIDDVPMCRIHGGIKALDYLINLNNNGG